MSENCDQWKLFGISQEDEYVHMAAQHYYIQFGSAFNKDNVQRVVDECIATQLIENKSMSRWIQLVSTAVLQVKCIRSNKWSCSEYFVCAMCFVVYGV